MPSMGDLWDNYTTVHKRADKLNWQVGVNDGQFRERFACSVPALASFLFRYTCSNSFELMPVQAESSPLSKSENWSVSRAGPTANDADDTALFADRGEWASATFPSAVSPVVWGTGELLTREVSVHGWGVWAGEEVREFYISDAQAGKLQREIGRRTAQGTPAALTQYSTVVNVERCLSATTHTMQPNDNTSHPGVQYRPTVVPQLSKHPASKSFIATVIVLRNR